MNAVTNMPVEIQQATARPRLEDRPLARRVGLIALATDHTSEPDFRRMVASERIGVYVARIAPETLVELGRAATAPDAEALFVSCTALRAALAAPGIEEAIGRPVVTSNQATAWNCLRLCGDEDARPEFGRLMTLPLAGD